MKTFEERMTYGEQAEFQFEKDMEKAGYIFKSTKLLEAWTSEFDLRNGDYYYSKPLIRLDVKRNSISERSLKNFEGNYYAVYHHNLSEVIFLKPEDLHDIHEEDWVELASGDKGIKFSSLKTYPHLTFNEFRTFLKTLV